MQSATSRRHGLSALATLALVSAPVPAIAKSPPQTYPEADEVIVIHLYSRCIAKYRDREARVLLGMDYWTSSYLAALKRAANSGGECAPFRSIRFNGIVFAGGLAEALLEKDMQGADLATRVAYDPSRPPLAARDEGEYVGLCTVRTAPAQVKALLDTKPAGAAEQKALTALAPVVSGCLSKNSKARFNKIGLRSLLALAAYRLAAHNSLKTTGS